MTSPEFEKVNELRSFRGSKKPVWSLDLDVNVLW